MFSAPLRMSCFTMLMCLFLLSSCRDSATLHRLEAVEAVIDANPELAWYMLDSIDGTVLRGEARALHALLSTQADYQCYVPLTSDSLILIAACYYGAGRPNYRAAMSRYYLGCTYTELGRDADAIRAYMQAIPLFVPYATRIWLATVATATCLGKVLQLSTPFAPLCCCAANLPTWPMPIIR